MEFNAGLMEFNAGLMEFNAPSLGNFWRSLRKTFLCKIPAENCVNFSDALGLRRPISIGNLFEFVIEF